VFTVTWLTENKSKACINKQKAVVYLLTFVDFTYCYVWELHVLLSLEISRIVTFWGLHVLLHLVTCIVTLGTSCIVTFRDFTYCYVLGFHVLFHLVTCIVTLGTSCIVTFRDFTYCYVLGFHVLFHLGTSHTVTLTLSLTMVSVAKLERSSHHTFTDQQLSGVYWTLLSCTL